MRKAKPTTRPAPPRPLPGWFWIIAALAALALVAWGALVILFPPARLRAMIETQAANAMGREVRLGGASLGFLPPVRLTVRDVAVAEPGGFAEGAALSARSVHLDLDVFALFGRRLVVRHLTLESPVLHMVMKEDGTTNLDGLGVPVGGTGEGRPAPPAQAGIDLAVNDFAIHGGEVLIDDLKSRRRTMFHVDTRLSLTARADQRIATAGKTQVADVAIGPLTARNRDELKGVMPGIEWNVEHDGVFDGAKKRLALDRLAFGFGRTELAFKGIVDDPGPQARMDLRASGEAVDLAEVLKILSAADVRALNGVSGTGTVAFDLGVRGPLTSGIPTLNGTVSVRDASFRYAGADAGVDALSFTARFAPDTVQIDDLSARVAVREGNAAPLKGKLLVWRFAEPQVRFAVVGDVNLAAISPLLAEQKTKLAGTAHVDVRGSGPAKDPAALALAGGGKFSNVSVESPDLPKRVENISGSFTASPTSVRLEGVHAEAGGSSFTLNADVQRPLALAANPKPPSGPPVAPAIVQFKLESPQLDLAELLPVTPGSPLLPNARGGGTVEIARFKQDKLDVKNLEARMQLEPGVVDVTEFNFEGYGGEVVGHARVNLQSPEKPVFAMSADVSRVNADDILSAWTPARGLLHGTLNTNIELSGEGTTATDLSKSLTAVGLAALADGTLGPGPVLASLAEFTRISEFKTLRVRDGSFPFAVEQGRVKFREVQFDGLTGAWRVAGSVGFDGSLDYALSATLPADVANQLGTAGALVAGALKDPDGNILLDLKVTGSAKSPRVSWDKSAMLDRLMGNRSKTIVSKGEKLGQDALQALGERGAGTQDTSLADYESRIRAMADSLKKLKGKDVLKNLFGGGKKDTVW